MTSHYAQHPMQSDQTGVQSNEVHTAQPAYALPAHDWDALFAQRDAFERWYRETSYKLDASAALLGDELNSFHFDWDAARAEASLDQRLKVALCDANATELASCTTAVKLFYQEFHELRPEWVVERVYCPFSARNLRLMEEAGIGPVSVEGHMPLASFDVLCFSQQMIGDEVSLIYQLQRAGIPLFSRDRTQSDPIVIRGGSSSFNPSLIMDICDLFFIGEGEEVLPELVALVEQGMREGRSRQGILLEAVQRWDCLWAPCFYEQRFAPDGTLLGMFPLRDDVPERIRSYHLSDLDHCFIITKPTPSYVRNNLALNGTEITRGCDGACAFCVSGFINMPFRARSIDRVMEVIKERAYHTGEDTLILSSFCGSSYPWINELMRRVDAEMPLRFEALSQRVDNFYDNPELCTALARLGVYRIVFGVEGDSQHLRQVVSKNYTEEQLLETYRMLCRTGYRSSKFMLVSGLPGERSSDFEELVAFVEKIRDIGLEEEAQGNVRTQLLLSWTPLRVYPFTPFQWLEAKIITEPGPPPEIIERIRECGVLVSDDYHNSIASDLRVVQLLLRGDSRLQEMLVAMAEAGHLHHGVFDSQAEAFASAYLVEHGLPDYDFWFAERSYEDVLPWDFLDYGPTRKHLWRRYQEAISADPHDYPRCLDRCQGCGACSSEEKRNMASFRTLKRKDDKVPLAEIFTKHGEDGKVVTSATPDDSSLAYALFTFEHDEAHRMVHRSYWGNELARALNYAGIAYSRQRVWVSKPYLPYLDWAAGPNAVAVGLCEKLDSEELMARVSEHTLHMRVTSVEWFDHAPKLREIGYRMPVPEGCDEEALRAQLAELLASESWEADLTVPYSGKAKRAIHDVRNWILDLELRGHNLHLKLDPRVPPYSVYCGIFGLDWEEAGRALAVREYLTYE